MATKYSTKVLASSIPSPWTTHQQAPFFHITLDMPVWPVFHNLRRSLIQRPAGLVAIFHLLILAFEALPHLASYLVQLDINLVNLLAQCQWPVFLSSCVSILWQLTCLCDLGLFKFLGVSLSWSGFDVALQSVIVMMIEAREWPLRRIYPMNIMIMDIVNESLPELICSAPVPLICIMGQLTRLRHHPRSQADSPTWIAHHHLWRLSDLTWQNQSTSLQKHTLWFYELQSMHVTVRLKNFTLQKSGSSWVRLWGCSNIFGSTAPLEVFPIAWTSCTPFKCLPLH